MTTVSEIVTAAAEEIGVKTAEQPLQAADFQLILDRLNFMLIEWENKGLFPTFKKFTSSTDVVDVEDSDVSAIIYNLAVRVAVPFQRTVTIDMQNNAEVTLKNLEVSNVSIGEVAYPDALPTGSGNDCGSIYTEDRFFPLNKKENF